MESSSIFTSSLAEEAAKGLAAITSGQNQVTTSAVGQSVASDMVTTQATPSVLQSAISPTSTGESHVQAHVSVSAPVPVVPPITSVASLQVPQPLSTPVPVVVQLLPCLKGTIFQEGTWIVCRGVWAMSEEQHSNPDLVSDFEFKINSASPQVVNDLQSGTIPRIFPLDGVYQGWFKLKKSAPLKGIDKIDEKNIRISFTPSSPPLPVPIVVKTECGSGSKSIDNTTTSNESSSSVEGSNVCNSNTHGVSEDYYDQSSSEGFGYYKVAGEGTNRFGTYTLQGTFNSADCSIVMLRQYALKPIKVPAYGGTMGGEGSYVQQARLKREKSLILGSSSSGGGGIGGSSSTTGDETSGTGQREGAGRIRKQSSLIQDFDSVQHSTSSTGGASHDGGNKSSKSIGGSGGSNTSKTDIMTPSQRQALQLSRCQQVYDEVCKHPSAIYFMTPVDPIALNIPDYPIIVTKPMDLGTINNNIQAGSIYNTANEFAEHMRLIFKNAILYNNSKDNLVHIAAKECSSKFEEKYKLLILSLNPASKSSGGGGGSKGKTLANRKYPGQGQSHVGGTNNSKSSSSSSSGGASRSHSSKGGSGSGSSTTDSSVTAMQEMQKQMLDMKNELERLRSAVGQDIASSTGSSNTYDGGDNNIKALTSLEKRALIDNISILPPSCIERIILIIQQGAPETVPTTSDGNIADDIEIPLDELDPYTLRRIHTYVHDVRKRQGGFTSTGSSSSSSSSSSNNSSAKRARTSTYNGHGHGDNDFEQYNRHGNGSGSGSGNHQPESF